MDSVVRANAVKRSWKESFAALKRFKAREGHCNVPRAKIEGKAKLGRWVRAQRSNRSKLDPINAKRLDDVGFIWNLRDWAWDEHYEALQEFRAREGHGCVPQHHVERGLKLGQWVNVQRKRRKKLQLERRQRLDRIGFLWDPRHSHWENMFNKLVAYKIKHGDCDVSRNHSDKLLIRWMVHQRSKKHELSGDRRERLNCLGFVWKKSDEAWQRGFLALAKFNAREGHCGVPLHHKEEGYNLGAWAREQRMKEGSIAGFYRRLLDEIGFFDTDIYSQRVVGPHLCEW